jgi:hypothetical protein
MNRYPRWEQAWSESLPDVDQQIKGFCANCAGAPEESLPELTDHITNWFDEQDLDDETLAEFDRVKQEPDYLENQVGGRLSYLRGEGAIEPRELGAGASPLGHPGTDPPRV